ncbi:hypothetical protein ACI2KO_11420 [Pseudomonas piscis]|uniref:hypothetical protein n=1 Tax=Pseudomonas piscis TaxID=2614538 RepID=UPI00385136BA
MKRALSAALCLALLSGCTTARLSTRTLQAEDRVITGIERKELVNNVLQDVRIICPEPSPDALKTFAASGTASKEDIAALSAAYQQSGASIGLRTQSIQLLRDQLFAVCQAYANGAITADMYQMYMTRNQRNTVAILAIEQLTGVAKGPAVALTSASSTANSQYLLDQSKIIKDAQDKLAKMTAGSEEAKTMQGNIDVMQAQLKQAQQAMVQTSSAATLSAAPATTLPAADVQAIAEAVQRITEMTTWTNDLFYICLNAYANLPSARRPPSLDSACAKIYDNLAQANLLQLKHMIGLEGTTGSAAAAPEAKPAAPAPKGGKKLKPDFSKLDGIPLHLRKPLDSSKSLFDPGL